MAIAILDKTQNRFDVKPNMIKFKYVKIVIRKLRE
jgi:hypothetical protein